MMSESEFHKIADLWLTLTADVLEEADQKGVLETELEDGALAILFPSGKQLLISKHTPMRQLWLASPVSGGLHFSFDGTVNQWTLSDGRSLNDVLAGELKTIAGISIAW